MIHFAWIIPFTLNLAFSIMKKSLKFFLVIIGFCLALAASSDKIGAQHKPKKKKESGEGCVGKGVCGKTRAGKEVAGQYRVW